MKKITAALAGAAMLTTLPLLVPVAFAQDDEEKLTPFFVGIDYVFGSVTFFRPQNGSNSDTAINCGSTTTSCDRFKFSPDAARITAGMNLGENFQAMVTYGRGNGEEKGTGNSNGAKTQIDSFYGVYGRWSTALQGLGGLRAGALVGYTSVGVSLQPNKELDIDPDPDTFEAGKDSDETFDGVSYGFELSYPIVGRSTLIVADWTSYVNDDKFRFTGANVGIRVGFGGGGEDDDDF